MTPITLASLVHDLRADDWWIMGTAVACAVTCGTLGCFLVLRRLSLLGDAISHAILPGLAIAFLVTGSRDPAPMLIGALVVGVITAVLTSSLNRWGRVPEDAAMGVVFSSLFALGVLLITWAAGMIDLDPGCVLYGLIEFVPLDTQIIAGVEIPRAFVFLAIVMLLCTAGIVIFFKELKIVSFDPALATSMGISAAVVHYGLMVAVAGAAVASFEAVGSILVVTMLVAPGATAHLLTDRLPRMLAWSALLATTASILGYLLAVHWNTSVAGMISVVAGSQFLLAAIFAPRYGVLARSLAQLSLSVQIAREDILGSLYREEEHTKGIVSAPREGATPHVGAIVSALARLSMRTRGLARATVSGRLLLTDRGRTEATQLVRTHRLWETYLATRVGLPPDHVHDPAERVEHFIGPELAESLAKNLKHEQDPHGKPIPPAP